mmetsp:Transcript_29835/g.88602  ORF Transcript_29835/g.88602 Transcript_29835/m.88602 type:complete len:204 (-) Transcript_29835:655-1266(-)
MSIRGPRVQKSKWGARRRHREQMSIRPGYAVSSLFKKAIAWNQSKHWLAGSENFSEAGALGFWDVNDVTYKKWLHYTRRRLNAASRSRRRATAPSLAILARLGDPAPLQSGGLHLADLLGKLVGEAEAVEVELESVRGRFVDEVDERVADVGLRTVARGHVHEVATITEAHLMDDLLELLLGDAAGDVAEHHRLAVGAGRSWR